MRSLAESGWNKSSLALVERLGLPLGAVRKSPPDLYSLRMHTDEPSFWEMFLKKRCSYVHSSTQGPKEDCFAGHSDLYSKPPHHVLRWLGGSLSSIPGYAL